MDTIEDFKKALIPKMSIDEMIRKIFTDQTVQDQAIEFNQDQLQAGKDALGQTITTIGGSPYRPYTVKVRKKKGLPTNIVTLEDTGEFYRTFKIRILSHGYLITAEFAKDEGSILDNFSSSFDFTGLDKESLTELVDNWIYPLLAGMLKKELGI